MTSMYNTTENEPTDFDGVDDVEAEDPLAELREALHAVFNTTRSDC